MPRGGQEGADGFERVAVVSRVDLEDVLVEEGEEGRGEHGEQVRIQQGDEAVGEGLAFKAIKAPPAL